MIHAPTGQPTAFNLFECVPNLSCARDPGLLDELEAQVTEAGTLVLDRSADADHRRSVWTWLGSPQSLEDAASRCLDLLAARRDLGAHHGVHPRTGLLDVFPWIPLAEIVDLSAAQLAESSAVRDSTLRHAISSARRAGTLLAERHRIPGFFYEHAATVPARRNLADHRRHLLGRPGRSTHGSLPTIPEDWPPDVGPQDPHPRLGVMMVGARRPLIAFNVDLETTDVTAARAIAGAIRQKVDGGLPGVKALGLFLPQRGCAQVSVNLVDARRTSLPELVARIRWEADRRGLEIRSGERIGLLTETAVAGASADDLALSELRPEHLVETHLRRVIETAPTQRQPQSSSP